jgi:hypothetical protein
MTDTRNKLIETVLDMDESPAKFIVDAILDDLIEAARFRSAQATLFLQEVKNSPPNQA